MPLKAVEDMAFHPELEKVVQVLCEKTQSNNPGFFRVLATFHFAMMASQMRVKIRTHDRGDIPVNMYALNLATSGAGKGFSTNILENEVTHLFREQFLESFNQAAEPGLEKLVQNRALRQGVPEDDMRPKVYKEFEMLGKYLYSFDSGTTPALKQMRHKLLMANLGSANLIIDEIGSNVIGNKEVLDAYLELYDVGAIREKLVKNTAENTRNEEIIGRTPTNLMMFGTPDKLLDGSKTEEELISMLETGYARRCFFSYSKTVNKNLNLTPKELYDRMTDKSTNAYVTQLAERLGRLSVATNLHKTLTMSEDVALAIFEYQLMCDKRSNAMPEHENIRKAEMSHRYFKALKAAGAYAFIDGSPELTMDHFENAIKLAEASGQEFEMLLSRDRPYVKLAKYLANVGMDCTEPDLQEDLPFFKGSAVARADMVKMAIAWGYKNNIIIKRMFTDGVEFFRGEALEETDLSKLIVAYTQNYDMTTGYLNDRAPWNKLSKLVNAAGFHWLNHHMQGGYRLEDNAIEGFNMIVLDIDGTMSLKTAKTLLSGYKAIYYTTKSHTDTVNRFRIILPTNYVLKLDRKEYTEFMKNVIASLPFQVDESCTHRSKKWLSHNGHCEEQDGELFDVLPYIPKTSQNEERKVRLATQSQLDNWERWILNNSGEGNRNDMLLRYAMSLKDSAYNLDQIMQRVHELNDKMPDKLSEDEINRTIMISVAKALHGS